MFTGGASLHIHLKDLSLPQLVQCSLASAVSDNKNNINNEDEEEEEKKKEEEEKEEPNKTTVAGIELKQAVVHAGIYTAVLRLPHL